MSLWETVLYYLTAAIYLLAFASAFVSIIAMMYHFRNAIVEYKSNEARNIMILLGPFALFIPSLYTKKGQHHLQRLAFYFVVLFVSGGVLVAFEVMMPAS